ncbi:MAG: ABC transporter ATP-binding protein [Nitrospirae bacterium]|nr:ABC transporter ATP-binding protein [Nitrospirota bacterium]
MNLINTFCSYCSITIRIIKHLLKAAPKEIFILVLALMIQGFLPAAIVWVNKHIIDSVTGALKGSGHGEFSFIFLFTAWLSIVIINAILNPWVLVTQRNLKEIIPSYFTQLLMSKSENIPDIETYEDPKYYDQLQLLQKQIDKKPVYFSLFFIEIIQQVLTVGTLFAILFYICWWLPLLLLITAIPEIIVSFKTTQNVWSVSEENSVEMRKMQYFSNIMLTNTYAKEVKVFGFGSYLIQRYRQTFFNFYQSMQKIRKKGVLRTAMFALVYTLGNALAFYFVLKQAFKGAISPGSLFLFVQSIGYTYQSLSGLIIGITTTYDALIYMRKFFDFIDRKSGLRTDNSKLSVPIPLKKGIIFKDVTFNYSNEKTVLDGVSFLINPGEIVALVGENGAGKSTIIKLLLRLYDPQSGKITIDGQDLRLLNIKDWRKNVSIVFQDFGKYAFTLGENIILGNTDVKEEIDKLDRASSKAGLSNSTIFEDLPYSYATQLGKQFNGTELSEGQWQKVALARAFYHLEQAQLIILDEPTSALDPRSEYELFSKFVNLVRGKTVLLITHRLNLIHMVNRILVIKNGRIIENGTHKQLLEQKGECAKLWEMQSKPYNIV